MNTALNVYLARILGFFRTDEDEWNAFEALVSKCESPMESLFLRNNHSRLSQYGVIVPQHRIDKYRVDFALPDVMIVIEIDGHEFHSSKEQIAADNHRARELMKRGWTIVRFSGSEVYADPGKCGREIEAIINGVN